MYTMCIDSCQECQESVHYLPQMDNFIFSNLLVSTTLKLILFFFQAAFFVSLDDEPQNYDKVSTLASTSTVHELFLKDFV